MKRERQCHSNKFLAWAILIFDSCCIPTRSIWLLTEARLVHMVRKPSEWIVQLSLKYLLYVIKVEPTTCEATCDHDPLYNNE